LVKKTKKTTEFKQPEVNIGLVGHVDNGKTTLLKVLSGKWADTHSEESKRGITIKLGYADVSFYKCKEHMYTIKKKCEKCELQRTVSFVDAPGHETLMATMLSGASIMDGALLLIAANEECPQPQTKEHLMALEILGIKNIIVVQNKIDLVTKEQSIENYKKIKDFLKGSIAENAPIVPISAIHNINIDYLVSAIQEVIPTPKLDSTVDPIMFAARSFDVNKPGIDISKMNGGVLGGVLKQGILKNNAEIEIKPGMFISERGVEKWISIKTIITKIISGSHEVEEASPGGSIAIQTKLDPAIVKSDQLAGSIVGIPGKLPETLIELTLEPHLLKRVVGSKEELNVEPIKRTEPLMINVNSTTTAGIVTNIEKNKFHIKLKRPICAEDGAKIAISRRIGTRWRLVGWAFVKK